MEKFRTLNNNAKTILALAGIVTSVAAIALGVELIPAQNSGNEVAEVQDATATSTPKYNPFADIILEAKAAFVFDVRQNAVLYEKNADSQLPLASLTKLMTVVAAEDFLAEDTTVPITNRARETEGGAIFSLGEKWRLKDLIDFTLVASSNSGARALASAAAAAEALRSGESYDEGNKPVSFIERMNAKAREIGLTQTYYTDETGLDEGPEVPGGFGSARDMAKLMAYLIGNRSDLIEATRYPSLTLTNLTDVHYRAKNTNEAIPDIPELLASKTGFTDLAGGNLLIAFDAGILHPIIVVVLGSSQKGRFSDIVTLVEKSLAVIQAP